MSETVDAAVAQARRVVGLYGDPDVSWSIVLALEFDEPLDRSQVERAAEELTASNPHLGRTPEVVVFSTDEVVVLQPFADSPYGDRDPLLRVALRDDGLLLVLAAHHGALDGLGMIGAASRLVGRPLFSSARGIERTAEPAGFVRKAVGRVAEALAQPPLRLAAHELGGTGDWLTDRRLDAARASTGALVAAASSAVRQWNRGAPRRPHGRRLVIAMGLSRRPGTPTPTPTRDTAYVRLPAQGVETAADGAALVVATLPEPEFPVSDGRGLAPRMVQLLGNRLGSTLLVSNLGLVTGDHLVGVRLWPVPSGPAGAAVGLATARGSAAMTIRLRRAAFSLEDSEGFAGLLAGELERLGQ